MDSTSFAALGRTVTKLLRLRKDAVNNLKLSKTKNEDHKVEENVAMESLLANLFAHISAFKAAYAELQLAQSPYDPLTIQSADQAVITELKHLSELKQSYIKNQLPSPKPHLAALQEQANLIKTYQITTKKLEAEVQAKDLEVKLLESKLQEFDNLNKLSSLNNLHFSGLNPNHFITVLKYTYKSVKSFVKIMIKEMEAANWDLEAAAAAIQPGLKPKHRRFAFESYVCQKMLSNFQYPSFSLKFLEKRLKWDKKQFFEEFNRSRFLRAEELVDAKSDLGMFCRAKYLSLVHPKMEAAFFGKGKLSGSEFSNGFAEMAKRVWLLHCLFFSFGSEFRGSVFQVRRGSRFSEVYMESVAEEEAGRVEGRVGFTVVPGFRFDTTVVQCKVFLLSIC